MNDTHAGLLHGLREGGHAVDFHRCADAQAECEELVEHAARFIDAALSVAGCPTSGRAYVRVSSTRGIFFVEVTHLSPGTFDVLTREPAAMDALDELREWAVASGRSLTVDRGPRDRFRVTLTLRVHVAQPTG
jgi:hypothetical protein